MTPFASIPSSPPTSTYGHLPEFIGGVKLGFVIGAPIVALGIIQLSDNSKQTEEQAISQYMQVHALPRKLAKRLRPEHFLPPNSPSPYR
ncbi:hypothetical protein ACFQT0_25330 [Hymenobacter humi]|uniref:YtxH domain-containing protein n=1 Tax=Hymenobacter humi TaxID=1411620 RepID=A0ABW2U9W4_9BACT